MLDSVHILSLFPERLRAYLPVPPSTRGLSHRGHGSSRNSALCRCAFKSIHMSNTQLWSSDHGQALLLLPLVHQLMNLASRARGENKNQDSSKLMRRQGSSIVHSNQKWSQEFLLVYTHGHLWGSVCNHILKKTPWPQKKWKWTIQQQYCSK